MVFKMQSSAIDFLNRVGSDPAAAASPTYAESLDYNKKIIKIAQKYLDDPETAYKEIVKLTLGEKVSSEEVQQSINPRTSPSNQGAWGQKSDNGRVVNTFSLNGR